jgi:hypothetical protein
MIPTAEIFKKIIETKDIKKYDDYPYNYVFEKIKHYLENLNEMVGGVYKTYDIPYHYNDEVIDIFRDRGYFANFIFEEYYDWIDGYDDSTFLILSYDKDIYKKYLLSQIKEIDELNINQLNIVKLKKKILKQYREILEKLN